MGDQEKMRLRGWKSGPRRTGPDADKVRSGPVQAETHDELMLKCINIAKHF